jgi:hypothetical protein
MVLEHFINLLLHLPNIVKALFNQPNFKITLQTIQPKLASSTIKKLPSTFFYHRVRKVNKVLATFSELKMHVEIG